MEYIESKVRKHKFNLFVRKSRWNEPMENMTDGFHLLPSFSFCRKFDFRTKDTCIIAVDFDWLLLHLTLLRRTEIYVKYDKK